MVATYWTTDDMVDMTGKNVLVTGGNGGIGYRSCKVLLDKNAKVYMASRDSEKTRAAIESLKRETGKEVGFIPLDLSDLRQVRRAAQLYLSKESRLDVLINNAGVMAVPVERVTKDGYDMQFGTNVLGHFHLTNLLLPALLASPAPRVVNLSSIGHNLAPSGGIQFDTLKGGRNSSWFYPLALLARYRHYGQSKLGNLLHANELARRYGERGLAAIAVHPGFVRTELTREHYWIENAITSPFMIAPEDGSLTQLNAASTPDGKELSGKYLIPFAELGNASAYGCDEELARKMWEWCEKELEAY